MQISYELTQHDFFESTIAIRNRKNWAKWGFRAILGLLLSLIALSALVLPRSQLLSNLTPLLLLLLLWVFLLLRAFFPPIVPRQSDSKQAQSDGTALPETF